MAERQTRVAILGTGFIADWHVKALRALGNVAVTAVCDLNLARARGFAQRYGIPDVHGSLRELLDRKAHDAVHVLVPAEGHFAAAREVLEAGVHALVEKPMCLEPQQCVALEDLAAARGVQVAVSHNFLFAEVYERLRRDVASGVLGRIDRVDIVWNKELGLVTAGPFDAWMVRRPENVILEVAPHSVAHLLDLVGRPDEMSVRATNPIDLPTGQRFYRRWRVEAYQGKTAVDLGFSFAPGFSEHAIHVRGSLAAATVDFERNTYARHRHVGQDYDLDRYAMIAGEAGQLRRQARRNLWDYAVSKLTKSPRGNPFGASIAASIAAFYSGLASAPDPRIAAAMGRDVVATCHQIIRLAALPEIEPAAEAPPPAEPPRRAATVLVIGATGFIGMELVRQLVARDLPTRVLARRRGGLAATLDPRMVEVMQGDASKPEDLDRALEGISHVYHLARAQAKTYEDFLRDDVEVTRLIAEKCLAHGVKRFFYASSIAPYYAGKHAGTITEQTPLDPKIGRRNAYARAKAASEDRLMAMRRELGLPVVIFRPGTVLGRGGTPYHAGVGLWSWNAICQYWGRGENPLPIVLVDDVAAAMVAAIDAERIDGESFNLVGEPCLTAREYVRELADYAGVAFEVHATPIVQFYLFDMLKFMVKLLTRHPDRRVPSYRDWESRSQRARYDCSKAKTRLGWTPVSDRAEIIRRAIHEPMAALLR